VSVYLLKKKRPQKNGNKLNIFSRRHLDFSDWNVRKILVYEKLRNCVEKTFASVGNVTTAPGFTIRFHHLISMCVCVCVCGRVLRVLAHAIHVRKFRLCYCIPVSPHHLRSNAYIYVYIHIYTYTCGTRRYCGENLNSNNQRNYTVYNLVCSPGKRYAQIRITSSN
jgi:hypothetical protein